MGYIGNTDKAWFDYLRGRSGLQEVNFWQPGSLRNFRAIEPGAPFFLRLKAPYRIIGGMGFFSRYVQVPVSVAWDAFLHSNGAPSLAAMRAAIAGYRRGLAAGGTEEIGCIMLFHPTFFPDSMWVPQPESWQDSIVSGARIDIEAGEGKRIFDECIQNVLALAQEQSGELEQRLVATQRYGKPFEVKPRLGQSAFRVAVTAAYSRSCAVTGEHSLPVLEAAHIRPYADHGDHQVSNGLLLRADIHKLFDKGYVTVTPDLKFKVSDRLHEKFANGKIYYALQGVGIREPSVHQDRPDRQLLQWHNENVFDNVE